MRLFFTSHRIPRRANCSRAFSRACLQMPLLGEGGMPRQRRQGPRRQPTCFEDLDLLFCSGGCGVTGRDREVCKWGCLVSEAAPCELKTSLAPLCNAPYSALAQFRSTISPRGLFCGHTSRLKYEICMALPNSLGLSVLFGFNGEFQGE